MTENATTFPAWISILDGDAACGRCPDTSQRDLGTDNLLDHLNDPALAHIHGDWANPTPAQNQARELAYSIDWPDPYGPSPAEVVTDAIVPLIEELNRLRAQQGQGTATLDHPQVAPELAKAGFATYLPREIEPAHAVVLTEDNLDQVAQAVGGKILEGRTRRLSHPAMGHQGPRTLITDIGEVLVQVSDIDPWSRDSRARFYPTTQTSFNKDYFLPGQPQHLDPEPAPIEYAERIRAYASTIDTNRQGGEEAAYRLDLALGIYDRLTQGDTEVLRDEQLYAARHLRDQAMSVTSQIPTAVEIAMVNVADWMITRPVSTRTPLTTKGARFTDSAGNTYADLGDGTLRAAGIQRFVDYAPIEPHAEVLFRSGPLKRVPLND